MDWSYLARNKVNLEMADSKYDNELLGFINGG
jgi:hypothetical protein